jgi:hypothetical protein
MATVKHYGDTMVLTVGTDDTIVASEGDVNDLIGETFADGAMIIAIPVDRLSPDFFQLRSGFAGAVAQKMVNYHRTLAVIGDITAYLAESNALRDWVRETNKGTDLWFLPDEVALIDRLG